MLGEITKTYMRGKKMCYNDTASRDSVVRYSIFTDKKRTNMYENYNGHF